MLLELQAAERSSHPPPLSDSSVPSDVWYYPSSTAQAGVTETNQLPDISTSSMIGPTATLYNPEETSFQQGLDHIPYQQWIEGYGPRQQQDQRTQQTHQHYSQQLAYGTSYGGSLHAPIPQIHLSYDFAQPQYQSSSSLSQYDGSTTDTLTQSNVGQDRDNLSTYQGNPSSYQGQPNPYSQVYPKVMNQSATSAPERTPEVANRSNPTQGPQQNLSQQSRQQQVQRKPHRAPQAPQAQQYHTHKFLAHSNSSENRQHASSNPSPPQTPPSIVWNSEPGYSIPKPDEHAKLGGHASSRVPSSNSGSSRPPTSRNTPSTTNSPNPIQFNPTTSGVSGSSPRASHPGTSNSTFVPEKTGHKRKRRKKNEPAQLSGCGGDSDSDSEDYEAGGISVGMGGLGVVGRGPGTKGSRL